MTIQDVPLYVDISGDTFNAAAYDRAYGDGAAQTVIELPVGLPVAKSAQGAGAGARHQHESACLLPHALPPIAASALAPCADY